MSNKGGAGGYEDTLPTKYSNMEYIFGKVYKELEEDGVVGSMKSLSDVVKYLKRKREEKDEPIFGSEHRGGAVSHLSEVLQ